MQRVSASARSGGRLVRSPGPQIVDHKVDHMVEELRHYQVSLARIPRDEVVQYVQMAFRWARVPSFLMTSSKKWQNHCKNKGHRFTLDEKGTVAWKEAGEA